MYFSHSIQLDWRILDEDFAIRPLSDPAGRDEIYADVRLANSWSGSIVYRVRTPTLYGYF